MELKRRVFVHLESNRAYGRDLLKGIYEFNNRHTHWEIIYESAYYLQSERLKDDVEAIRSLKPDGCILEQHDNMDEILSLGIPTVQTVSMKQYENVPNLIGNYDLDGKMACDYFIKLGFRNLAFFGADFLHFSVGRHQSFRHYAGQQHIEVHANIFGQEDTRNRFSERFYVPLQEWLLSLPKPVGILACNDELGQVLINACSAAEIKVPYEVAVLGVDNDELLCNITVPNLSSISRNLQAASSELCMLLDRMMNGESVKQDSVQVNPVEVVVRQSTDTIASDDPEVIKAIAFIHNNIHRSISVEDVAHATTISRRQLANRFKAVTGTSIHDEIQFRRLQSFKRLLINEKRSIKEIAYMMGFQNIAHVSRWFAAFEGKTPTKWRKESNNP